MDADTILMVQTALATLGFRLNITSELDETTVEALKDFQINVLLEPTGEIDAETLAAIKLLDNAWEGKPLPEK
jgi:peptidoglycan hydrolase-like protein with peptidoglycan-binding domain